MAKGYNDDVEFTAPCSDLCEEVYDAIVESYDQFRPFQKWLADGMCSVNEVRKFLESRSNLVSEDLITWQVRRSSDGKFLGLCDITNRGSGVYSIGYWIRVSEHRNGYGSATIMFLVSYGFKRKGAKVIFSAPSRGNVKAIGLLESLGFRLVGYRADILKYRYEIRQQN